MPGPLFSFAAYLGAGAAFAPNGVAGALLALVAVFLPGMLVLLGALPFWESLRRRPAAHASLNGINAAVVGILAAALYDPVVTGAVSDVIDAAIAAAGFAALVRWRAAPGAVMVGIVAASMARLLWSG
jgi:chromate transporter